MTEIQQLVEIENVVVPDYSGREFSQEQVVNGSHRSFVGGRWDEDGALQARFLTERGLGPATRFLDVGAGAFRAGRHIIDVVDPGNYYAVDANRSLLQTGYDVELTDEQRARVPVANIRANDRFNVDFGVRFDMAIAQSVFTHVSLNHIRLCLFRLGNVMKSGGVFYATFFEQPNSRPLDHVYHRVEGGRAYLNEQNVFWYPQLDMRWAGTFGPWDFQYIGDWGSPHGQRMVAYTRISDQDHAERTARERLLRSGRGTKRTPQASEMITTARAPATGARRIVNGVRRRAARLLDPDT